MSAKAPSLAALRGERPEWSSWLDVIDEVLQEAQSPHWAEFVPTPTQREEIGAPRLDGATVIVDAPVISHLLERLLRAAARGDTPQMATLARVTRDDVEPLQLFHASLTMDAAGVLAAAAASGADRGAVQAVVALLPVPFLQACQRGWPGAVARGGRYCPICGSWPSFVEVRGIERTRHYRCSRCGAGWRAPALTCPYCATADHHDLVSLVPAQSGTAASVDACKRCHGFVKVFNRLQGCAPHMVLVEDLAAVALDIVALESGYTRPSTPGYPIEVTVVPRQKRSSRGYGATAPRP